MSKSQLFIEVDILYNLFLVELEIETIGKENYKLLFYSIDKK